MAEKGQVTQVKPDGKVVVKLMRTEACAKCRACMVFSSKEMILEAINKCGAKAEEWVELEMQHDGFYTAVLIMYGFPCLGLLLGIFLGYFGLYNLIPGFNREILSFICGLIGIFICHLIIKKNNYRWENNTKYIPVAARLAKAPTPEEYEYQLMFDEHRA